MRVIEAWPAACPSSTPRRWRTLLQKLADRVERAAAATARCSRRRHRLGGRQLAPRRRVAVGLPLRLRLEGGLPVDLLVAYGLANILAVIPITPSGLGVVEGVLIPTLVGFHVPKTTAILGVIGYRLINFWLPIPVGGASYLSLRWRGGGRRTPSLPRGPEASKAPLPADGAST